MKHKKDGGTYRHAVLDRYDLSPLVGFPASAHQMPVLRCSKCGVEQIRGEVVEPLLDALGVCITVLPTRLSAAWAVFLRKRLGLTQAELATRMGCDRQTVAKWETRGVPISKPYDFVLRGVYLAFLAAKPQTFRFQVEEPGRATFAALSTVRDRVASKIPDPVVIENVNQKLRIAQRAQ